MNAPADFPTFPNSQTIICELGSPVQSVTCYLSLDSGSSWRRFPMSTQDGQNFLCDIPIMEEGARGVLFFEIIDLSGVMAIETNQGAFFHIISSHVPTISPSPDMPPSNPPELDKGVPNIENTAKISENNILPPESGLIPDHFTVHSPFLSQSDFEMPTPKRIIHFHPDPLFIDKEKQDTVKIDPLEAFSITSNHCPSCNARYPKYLPLCPYCGKHPA